MGITTNVGVFSPQDARDIKERVLNSNRSIPAFQYPKGSKLGWHYVILKEVLAPATDPLTGYSQADAAVMMYLEGEDTLDMEEVLPEENRITITNRSPFISGAVGDVALVRWIIKEWAPIWCAASTFRHGLVSEVLGCGYYVVELGTFDGDIDTAGSGIGSDTSSGADRNCDVCYDVHDVGNESCGITLSYPPVRVTGNGEFVTAYHRASALVPLVVGSACYLTGTGDTATTSASADSGEANDASRIWHIVDGLQEHTVQYIENWSCCDGVGETGVETLLSRIPVIFAAKVCDPIECGTCAVPSSV